MHTPHSAFTLQLGRSNCALVLGRWFEISSRGGDFLLRVGRKQVYRQSGYMGGQWSVEAVEPAEL